MSSYPTSSTSWKYDVEVSLYSGLIDESLLPSFLQFAREVVSLGDAPRVEIRREEHHVEVYLTRWILGDQGDSLKSTLDKVPGDLRGIEAFQEAFRVPADWGMSLQVRAFHNPNGGCVNTWAMTVLVSPEPEAEDVFAGELFGRVKVKELARGKTPQDAIKALQRAITEAQKEVL